MKSLRPNLFCIAVGLFVLSATPAWTQNIPADLEVVGVAGGLPADAEYATVSIATDGRGSYHRFESADFAAAVLDSGTFTLSTADVEQLWQAIQAGDFFNLGTKYANEETADGTFAQLIITANGSVHAVTTENTAVAGFDDIISTVNALTPGSADLVYDTSDPVTFTPGDICGQPGNLRPGTLNKQFNVAGEPAIEFLTATDTHRLNNEAHPGTMVGYRMTLEQAISAGIVSLSAKGGTFFGDGVAISIDNTSNVTTDRLSATLYLDLYGPAASASNAQAVEDAIENAWGGHITSSGEPMIVDVVTRTTPGITIPGTLGFHQILMSDNFLTSTVTGRGTMFDVNWGTGLGKWKTKGKRLHETYAHEAGHLFGLQDRYEGYHKQADGTWERESDSKSLTSPELANIMAPYNPHLTTAQLQTWLEKNSTRRAGHPMAGSEGDLMATKTGTVQQDDIDAIAAQAAGLIIEVRPGTLLVNKDGRGQNFIITRSEDVFVPPGNYKTLGGLYVACIDYLKEIPNGGAGFDLAPPLTDWRGIEAAQLLGKLVEHVDDMERFCPPGYVPQVAIWRLTDNLIGEDLIDAFLLEAGIDIEDRLLDFPRLTNPNATDSSTSLVTPLELFVLDVASSPGTVLNPGETVTLTGMVHTIEGLVTSTVLNWSLYRPAGSTTTLTSQQGGTTSFTPDMRGFYEVLMQAELTDTLANSFTRESVTAFAAADANTETFESGSLEPEAPFYWKTSVESPWLVTQRVSNTGALSAASGAIDDNGMTTLEANFEQIADGTMSFAYKVSSEPGFDFLVFSIDGEVQERWTGLLDWNTFSIDLTAGEHTAVWTYEKDGSYFEGLDRVWIDDVFFPESSIFTSIEDAADDVLPAAYQLSQNYPNPFNPTTTISYAIPQSHYVTLVVYNALGRQVTKLVDGHRNRGRYRVQFDASDLSNGIYYYELHAGRFRERKAMVLLK